VNHPDETGHTPLHLAAAVGNVSAVATLLSLGALKSAKTHANLTPAQLAREYVKGMKTFAQTFGVPYKPGEVDLCIEMLR
jgi:ankyrin repeat protein